MKSKAKPFIKWVGGKSQLIEQLDALLPVDFAEWSKATYIEPFIGGGAMLFHMLQRYQNIEYAVINDVNQDLITCYRTVRDNVEDLIDSLKAIENSYYALPSIEAKREFYLAVRSQYNCKNLDPIANTVKFFFLNRTCFNGLYRVNRRGIFNVPFGRNGQPMICDPVTLRNDSELLRRVEILCGDFEATFNYTTGNTLFYFDPPYRPLSGTSNFNDYDKEPFNDKAQIRLKEFCDKIHLAGFKFMLSNSDGKGKNNEDCFFDDLYSDYDIRRVWASRCVNANPEKRGKLTEILVSNYSSKRGF